MTIEELRAQMKALREVNRRTVDERAFLQKMRINTQAYRAMSKSLDKLHNELVAIVRELRKHDIGVHIDMYEVSFFFYD